MMSFAEFNRRARELAGGRYVCIKVQCGTHPDGSTELEWSAYVNGVPGSGWTDEHAEPEGALHELRQKLLGIVPAGADPASVDPLVDPATTEPDAAAAEQSAEPF